MIRFEVAPLERYTHEAHAVAQNLREEDIEELWMLSRSEPEDAVKRSIGASDEAYIVRMWGKPVAVFGACAPALGTFGVPWLLGTRGLDACPNEIISYSRRFTDHLLERCTMLENTALASNRRTLVFLKRVGFDISAPYRVATGADAVTFRKERVRPCAD